MHYSMSLKDIPMKSEFSRSQHCSAVSMYFRSPPSSFCCCLMVSLSVFLFSWNSPSFRMSSELFSASFFSASASFDSRSLWEERRVSSSEEAAAREVDAPTQDKSSSIWSSDHVLSETNSANNLGRLIVSSSNPHSPA
jgi:hypothetical protein